MDPVDIFNISLIEKKTPDDTSLCSYSNRLTGEEGLIMTKITCLRRLSGLLYPDKAAASDKPSHFIYSPALTQEQRVKYSPKSREIFRQYTGIRGLFYILTKSSIVRPHPSCSSMLQKYTLDLQQKTLIFNANSELRQYMEREQKPIEKRSRVTKKKYQEVLDENQALKKRIIELEGKILKIIEY